MPVENPILWNPPQTLMEGSNMKRYMRWLSENQQLEFANYDALYQWSVRDIPAFWESIWKFFDLKSSGDYSKVLERPAQGMIGARWFEGTRISYAEHIFRQANANRPAIVSSSENGIVREVSWAQMESEVASIGAWLKSCGVGQGDRVAGILPNIPETISIFLAVNSLGAVWSSCSPDFGEASVIDRFQQIEPKVVFLSDGYTYNGKAYPKSDLLPALRKALPSAKYWVLVPWLDTGARTAGLEPIADGLAGTERRISGLDQDNPVMGLVDFRDLMKREAPALTFTEIPFNDPIWILFSSGTTGKPKAITHSAGGCLLEHLKALALHQDVQPGERYFWYSTTGWMMWNYALASLLCGASLVIYEGAAGYPGLERLWQFADVQKLQHFGAGAAFYIACMKAGLQFPNGSFPILRTIGSTGSPLPPQAFEWIYRSVKKDAWLISLSGGTDICSAFVGGCPLLPVYEGEIQTRMLSCALEAFDENGKPVRNALGEMVILEPMPSMPIYFWGDQSHERYHASYFEQYPGIWRHGDYIRINDHGGVEIFGRSDATLNRDGVRIGTAEIYQAVEQVPEVLDSLVVCLERADGSFFMPLFVVMKPGVVLSDEIQHEIRKQLRVRYSPRHVPDKIIAIPEIPYTISGKKMEAPVKKILMGTDPDKAASRDTMRNPWALGEIIGSLDH
jgi:acetoacetyl-CoA synthetase